MYTRHSRSNPLTQGQIKYPPEGGCFIWCRERDSNPRRHKPTDLQSVVFDRFTIPARRNLRLYLVRRLTEFRLTAMFLLSSFQTVDYAPWFENLVDLLEPPVGFGPTTFTLQKCCSTAELRWHDSVCIYLFATFCHYLC